ncbi:MAG: FtsX-like permease family protein [Bacteroidales bacterium]
MNLERFIAKRIFSGVSKGGKMGNRVVMISQLSIILGIIVMLLSVSIVLGYKKEVAEKAFGFGAHIQLVQLNNNSSYETEPMDKHHPVSNTILGMDGVSSISPFATKPGVLKTDTEIHGVVFKGVDNDFDWGFFSKNIVQGEALHFMPNKVSNDVMVSSNITRLLKLSFGDEFYIYFINDQDKKPRVRKLKIAAVYSTGLEEFDDLFLYGDLRQVQQVSQWDSTQVSGFEVRVADVSQINEITEEIASSTLAFYSEQKGLIDVNSVIDIYPQIFDWLALLDMNVYVIIVLILLIVGVCMVSGLLVIILENTYHIGVLKTLGYPNSKIRRVFRNISFRLIVGGLAWGNIIAYSFMFIQKYFNVIKLDPETYYLSSVPIHFGIMPFVLVNVGTVILILLIMGIPAYVADRISPSDAMRFNA